LRLMKFRIVFDLAIGLRAHLHFLRHRRHQQLRPASIGIRFAPGQPHEANCYD
jgi:hypothetical protein